MLRADRTAFDRGNLGFGSGEVGLGLAHVVIGLPCFGAGGLCRGKRVLGGFIGGDLVGGGALLQGNSIGDRVERLRRVGGRVGFGRRGGCYRRGRVPMLASSTDASGRGGLLTGGGRLHLRQRQKAMGELDWLHVARRDDDAGAHLGHAVELRRETGRKANATVRGRIARHDAGVHGNSGPGDALHDGIGAPE